MTEMGTEHSDESTEKQSKTSTTRRSILGAVGATVGAGLFTEIGSADGTEQRHLYGKGPDGYLERIGTYSANNRYDKNYQNEREPGWHFGEIVTRGMYKIDDLAPRRNAGHKSFEINTVLGTGPLEGLRSGSRLPYNKVHIHVHGHNTSHRQARQETATVSKYDGARRYTHYAFIWDSLYLDIEEREFKKFQWSNSRTIARANGKRLGNYIATLKQGGVDKVAITAYSLGSQVALEAIRFLDRVNTYSDHTNVKVDGLFFMGAAVPKNLIRKEKNDYNSNVKTNKLWYKYVDGSKWEQAEGSGNKIEWWEEKIEPYGQELEAVVVNDNKKRIYNYYSSSDGVLRYALPAGDLTTDALGLVGVTRNVPAQFKQVDRGVKGKKYGHEDYITKHKHWEDVYGEMYRL